MANEPQDLKLGTLLSYFDIVAEEDVKRGLILSQHAGIPLGKSLVMLDMASPEVVRATIEAQSMLKDGLLKYDHAREAMGVVFRKGWSLTDALVLLGIDAYATRGTRLGEMLTAAGYINEANLEMALKASDASGLPLGRVLVLLGKITEPSLDMALKLQRAVRARDVTRQDAIKQLEEERPFKSELLESDPDERKIRIGKLLIMAGLLQENEVESAAGIAKANDKMIGEVLVEMDWLSADVLTAALRLQEMIWNGSVTTFRAIEVLKDISALGMSVDEGLREAGLAPTDFQSRVNFCDFLRLTGYLDKRLMKETVQAVMDSEKLSQRVVEEARRAGDGDDLKEAIKMSFRDNELLGEILTEVRPGDRALIGSALVMHELLRTGKLNLDQAVINFTIRRNGLRFS